MPKIYLICGFIGAGKTTYSHELAQSMSAFRFSIDEWMIPLFGEHMPREDFNHRLAVLTEQFKRAAEQLIHLGIPVIFDLGVWYKAQRVALSGWAKSIGADFELIYLQCPFETCRTRAIARNHTCSGKSFEMTDEMLTLFWSWFEEPGADEVFTLIQRDT